MLRGSFVTVFDKYLRNACARPHPGIKGPGDPMHVSDRVKFCGDDSPAHNAYRNYCDTHLHVTVNELFTIKREDTPKNTGQLGEMSVHVG